jgi:hypothetical protein
VAKQRLQHDQKPRRDASTATGETGHEQGSRVFRLPGRARPPAFQLLCVCLRAR